MSGSKGIWIQMSVLSSSEMEWNPLKLYDFISNGTSLMVKGIDIFTKGTLHDIFNQKRFVYF